MVVAKYWAMKLSLYPSAPDLSSGTVIGVQSGATVQFPLSLFLSSSAAQFAPIESPTFTGTVSGITASMVGLGNVNNTSDANKPISTPTQLALDLKAPSANPTFTGNVSGITANMVGLGNVSNTADIDKPISLAMQTALNLKASLASPTFTGTVFGITADMVGLGNVDNTGDYGKPVSTATQQALNAKANIASPTFTGTVNGITAAMVGLGNVNNTSDANKPISTATQTALDSLSTTVSTTIQGSLDLKAPLASPAFTGTVTGITKAMVGLGNTDDVSDANKPISTATQTALNLKAPVASPTFTGTVSGITATMVGLGNVTNTSDANKPVSTAMQTALNLKADQTAVDLKAPIASPTFTGTVSGITSFMVGLGNVDNTSDLNKPVSTATTTALAGYTPRQDGTRTNLNYNTTLTSGLYNVDTAPTNGPSGVTTNQLFVMKGTDTGFQISGGNTFDMYHRGWSATGSTFTAWKKVWDSSNLTNLNQLTNGPGYLTGITSAQVTGALTYTPVNKAGDTVSGNLAVTGILSSQSGTLQFGGSAVTGFFSDGTNVGIRAYSGTSTIYFTNGSGSSTLGTWATGGLTVNTAANFASTLTVSGSTVWTAANLTAVSQLSNNSGYTVASGAYTWSAPQIFNSTHTINTTIDAGANRINAGYWYDGNDSTYFIDPNNTSNVVGITGAGVIQSNASLRAPIFYDSANTGYYIQPRGQSRVSSFNQDTGVWNISSEGYYRELYNYGDHTQHSGGNGGTYNHTFCYHGGPVQWLMYATNFYASGNIIAYWSDKRLKKNLDPLSDWRTIIDGVSGYRFDWNEWGEKIYKPNEEGKREVGLLAQDVAAVFPEAVVIQEMQYKSKGVPRDDINYDPNDPYKTILYDKFVPVLIESSKSAHSKLDDHDELLRQILAHLERIENGR